MAVAVLVVRVRQDIRQRAENSDARFRNENVSLADIIEAEG